MTQRAVQPTPVTRASVGLRSERGPVLAALMITISLIALEATVLATAIPTIVEDLGGYTQFPWLFSAYLLTQAATVPIYGKLSDMIGRKPIMIFGIALFLAYAAVVFPLNLLLGSNFGYIGRPDPELPATLMNVLGPWPWRLIPLAGLVFAAFAIIYVPWILADRFGRKGADTTPAPYEPNGGNPAGSDGK